MATPISPNDLCWCGSNQKFKECHKNRSQQERPTIGEFLELTENQFQIKYCSHPEASENNCKKIAKAHSISKIKGLKPISRDNHVYTFIPTQVNLLRSAGKLNPSLIGVNKASTFPGFCSFHDSITFQPVDTQDFNFSRQHILLLSYRSVCRELYAKEAHLDGLDKLRNFDAGLPFKEQVQFQVEINQYKIFTTKGLEELKTLKQIYDINLKVGSFNSLNSYIICFEGVLPVVCSGTGQFLYDAFQNLLQNLDDLSIDSESTSFHIIPVRRGTVAVFTALGKCDVWKKLIDSLDGVENKKIGDFLIKFAFFNFENIYASPTWWDSLNPDTQDYILKLTQAMADPETPVEPPNVSDDFDLKTQWKALSRSILYAES